MAQKSKKSADQSSADLASQLTASNSNDATQIPARRVVITKESTEQFARPADSVARTLKDTIAVLRGNVEACIESGNRTAAFAKDISGEVYGYANRTFSNTSEFAKDAFACRTTDDVVELQSKLISNTMETFFSQSNRLLKVTSEYAMALLEPIEQQVAEAA